MPVTDVAEVGQNREPGTLWPLPAGGLLAVESAFGAIDAPTRRTPMLTIRYGTLLLALVALGGCATSFTGSPKVENGRAGCEKKCADSGMELAGMVYMGEYSDACVCQAKGHGSASSNQGLLLGSAGPGAGAAGVWMEMLAAEQQRRAAAAPGH
jgi:hypothetical protein